MSQILFNFWSRLSYFVADFKYYLILLVVTLLFSTIILVIKRNKLIILILSTVNCLLITVIFAEAYYRYVFDATDNVYHIKTTRRWIDRHVQWNSSGYRDDHFWRDKDPRETRIAFIGDSYTFGYGIKDINNRYTELLGEKLRSVCPSNKTLKTYNFGLPGNQSKTYVKQVPLEVLRYHPNAIIMEYYFDDIDGDKLPDQDSGLDKVIYSYKNKPILGFLLKHSYALEYLYIRLAAFLSPRRNWSESLNFNATLYRDSVTWQRHLSTLQSIIASLSPSQTPLAVFLIPLSHRLGPNYPLTDIHRQLIEYFQGLNIPVVDMLPILSQYRPDQIMISRHDFHLNEFGHQLITQELYKLVKDIPAFQCR